MHISNLYSISNKLYLLIIISVLPVLVILLYSGLEQREQAIENAQKDVRQLVHGMCEMQKEIMHSTENTLFILTNLPAIQNMDPVKSNEILQNVIKQNPIYNNMALVDLKGEVLASGRPFKKTNLGDRKHVTGALKDKMFTVGEFIISRVGVKAPVFAFAYPILKEDGEPKGVLTAVLKLSSFAKFHDVAKLPAGSFVGVTDHKGIRLSYYPAKNGTNPVGKPIKKQNWEIAQKAKKAGMFTAQGSDGERRIFAFEPISLTPKQAPYLYVWAGIPESYVLDAARRVLVRNLVLMGGVILLSLLLVRLMGRYTIISPIQRLVEMTRRFAAGELEHNDDKKTEASDELGELNNAFYDMRQHLFHKHDILKESEARFRHIMDSLNAIVYVADMKTYEVLFINEYCKKLFGDITGKICWQSLQQGCQEPCEFCTNKYLLDEKGKPTGVYTWEFKNTIVGKWYHLHDRAITWSDGRIVRLEIATDITSRKENELIKDALIEKLEKALAEIKTLRGIIPICSICKKIRDDNGYFELIEDYMHKYSGVDFSHTICPDCLKKHYPDECELIEKRKAKLKPDSDS